MRVVILGSKPGERIVGADVVYAANGGFLAYPVEGSLSLVLSAGAFAACLRPDANPSHEARQLFEGLGSVRPARLLVTASEAQRPLVDAYLQRQFADCQTQLLSPLEREAWFLDAGLPPALLPDDFFALRPDWSAHHLEQLALAFRRRAAGQFVDLPHQFRPSTGLFALVAAIREFGTAADYVLCGIGAKERGVHSYHAGANFTSQQDHGLLPHVDADLRALRLLAQRLRIASTNPDLCRRGGLQPVSA